MSSTRHESTWCFRWFILALLNYRNLEVEEIKQNTEVRWREHCFTRKMSEVGDHLLMNPGHTGNWEILTNATKQVNEQKILEAFYIKTFQSILNNQLNT